MLAVLLSVGGTLKAQDKGFTTLTNGVQYKIYTPNNGEKVKPNDVMVFNFIQKTDKDSVLLSSYTAGRPVIVPLQPSQDLRDLMYFFPLMAAKDSALVRIPADSLFAGQQGPRPSFLGKGSYLNFIIKMEKVSPMQEYMDKYKNHMDSLSKGEKALADSFVTAKKLVLQPGENGLRYQVLVAGKGVKPVKGDSVWVNYTGRLLNGKVFDSSVEAVAKEAGLSQPGRKYEPIKFVLGAGNVIPGWDQGIALLTEGSKATLLIPSTLAYGEEGAGEDIAPFSTLLFDVELVKVRSVKKVLPATKSSPARKMSPTKAPLKKTAVPVKKAGAAKPTAKTVKK